MDIKEIVIEDLKKKIVKGIEVALPYEKSSKEDQEKGFSWIPNDLIASYKTSDVSGGYLVSYPRKCEFDKVESHIDGEMFYFVSGTALMPFVDYKDGKPDLSTMQIVRIRPGTTIYIHKGKGHFVCVPEGNEPVVSVVCAPRMDAPIKPLEVIVRGISKE